MSDRNNAYQVTGLMPNTSYDLSVTSFNGLRESTKQTVTVKTRGLRVTVPVTLPVDSAHTLIYLEYPLGSVPIGTEPKGFFGGGNRQEIPAKVISSSGGNSTLEITNTFNLMNDNLTMKQLPDGSFGVFDGYKALYFKR
ncbi:hypothetical protein DKZ34_06595 [Limosilactobacillus reuteri]|uniref:Baseplate upper protein immunoglobulin like domain-containing protein n=1 Tax=Limosilactobacillus reuteri TaxID=1598 RepID=A0ABD6Y6Z4_LIMRT|nr:hypothetical protein DKZ35_04655 [Limosilactobacillus reuteri]PWT40229.1 hypothetical protein DKZ34_06595 [Limosilactobacillus reuteri]